MAKHELHVSQRQGRILGHTVGRGVPQRMQRRRGASLLVHPLEHAVHRMIGQRPDRAPQRPPQRLPPPGGDQPGHLHLIKPQPHERVGGSGQLLQMAGALTHDSDQLPPRIHPRHRGRQQLRRPRPGRHIERHQRPVPVRRQPREDLVELLIRHAARNPGRHPRPEQPAALVAIGLHGIVVSVSPAATAEPVQRKRVDDRTGARIPVQVIEGPQHRLRMRAHRRRIRPARGRARPPRPPRRRPLAPDLKPPAEITRLDAGCPIPAHSRGIKEPEPPQQIHPIRADRGLRSPRRKKIPEEPGRSRHHRAVRTGQLIRLVTIARRGQPAPPGHHQAREISPLPVISDHGRRPYPQKRAPAC